MPLYLNATHLMAGDLTYTCLGNGEYKVTLKVYRDCNGIDVGSIEFIHNQIVAKRDEGVAVLVVSSELDEIMALSDRIVVMYKGSVIDIVARADATRETLGLLMAGVKA